MTHLTRQEGHLLVAAIRLLAHQQGQPPEPAAVAELLGVPEATVRLQAALLQDLDAVTLVESAFSTHLEIHGFPSLAELPEEQQGEISQDLADFDRRKQAEAEKMSRLFADGEHDKRQAEKHGKMDDELRDFKKRKPHNPFDDD